MSLKCLNESEEVGVCSCSLCVCVWGGCVRACVCAPERACAHGRVLTGEHTHASVTVGRALGDIPLNSWAMVCFRAVCQSNQLAGGAAARISNISFKVEGAGGECGWEEEAQVAQKEFLQPNSGRTDSYNEVSINNVSSLLV